MAADQQESAAATNGGGDALPPAARERIIERTLAQLRGECPDLGDPLPAAERFVERFFMKEDQRTLHFWQDAFCAYSGTHYAELPIADLRERIYRFGRAGERSPKKKHVDDMIDALRAVANLSSSIAAPSWIDSRPEDPAPADLVAVSNGILETRTGTLLPPSARFFTRHALPFAYDPGAPEPTRFLAFLHELWSDDEDSIALLQEWFGYVALTADTSQQKALSVVGPPRSGKGTLGRVLAALLGRTNVGSPTLASLGLPFGLQSLIGKPLALISDVRLGSHADLQTIAENLLRISGEDLVSIPRKFLPDYTATLPTRFMLLSNETPRFSDGSRALASRFLVLPIRTSFYGREDPRLTAKLLAELPGILNWALAGLASLRDRGHFVQPDSARDVLEEIDVLAAPMVAFLAELVDETDPAAEVECRELFNAWRRWCAQNGREHPGSLQAFGRDLRAIRPALRIRHPRIEGRPHRMYVGMRLLAATQ